MSYSLDRAVRSFVIVLRKATGTCIGKLEFSGLCSGNAQN